MRLHRLTEIQYVGDSGVSRVCLEAVMRLIQFGDVIDEARLLTAPSDRDTSTHAFLLSINGATDVAIRSGLTSGYAGEGPRTLAEVLALLLSCNVEIEEYAVPSKLLDRLNESSLTRDDVEVIKALRPIRPTRFHDYIVAFGQPARAPSYRWSDFPAAIPFAILDARIADLAVTFWSDPDSRLMTGYRRLEGRLRERIQMDEHGSRLISAAFNGNPALLKWNGCNDAECKGRAQLFTGAFMGYRNRRAHKDVPGERSEQLRELLLLNELFLLEAAAIRAN